GLWGHAHLRSSSVADNMLTGDIRLYDDTGVDAQIQGFQLLRVARERFNRDLDKGADTRQLLYGTESRQHIVKIASLDEESLNSVSVSDYTGVGDAFVGILLERRVHYRIVNAEDEIGEADELRDVVYLKALDDQEGGDYSAAQLDAFERS